MPVETILRELFGEAGPGTKPFEDRAIIGRTYGVMWTLGAGLIAGTQLLPHDPDRDLAAMLAISAFCLLCGVLWLGVPRLMPSWLPTITPALGIVVITLIGYFAGAGAAPAYILFYFWAAIVAFLFLEPNLAAVQTGFALACYAALLAVLDVPLAGLYWVMAAGTVGITGAVIGALRSEVSRLVDELSAAARTDGLTGLVNRRGLDERITEEVERAVRAERPLSTIVCDLDGLKEINDRLGHRAGDVALKTAAAVMRSRLRRIDITARLGGDEFAIVLPERSKQEARDVAERIRLALAAQRPAPARLTASLGVATFPGDGDTVDGLLAAADHALYAAKQRGRNTTVVYDPGLEARIGAAK